jgi:transcriptional regulator with GAF, ATPase, and Fis domain
VEKKRIHVSFYIFIPAIFSGITILAVIVAFRMSAFFQKSGMAADAGMAWLIIASAVFSFLCGILIMHTILKPIARFVRTAKSLPALAKMPEQGNKETGVENIEELHRVLDQVTTILSKVEAREEFPHIIGQSRAMRAVFSQIMKVAPTDTTVLLSGESGTGKELVATAIYDHSLRHGKPFIKVNCVAIPEGLLESELFGHEKGAFTGATARKKGKFELADGGAIFLDEIGDMPPATQAKLLRVLQEREFERVGGNDPIRVDVRFIAATNKDLTEMVKTGAFREDLFYRLSVFNIHLPPLRERREDIPFLAEHFLDKRGKSMEVSPKAMEILLSAPWPGNIRELQNVMERAAVMAEEGFIEPGHLPANLMGSLPPSVAGGTSDDTSPLDDRLAELEKGMIMEALTRAGGIQARAAEILGINQRSLWHRIKKYDIDVTSFKKLQNL